MFSFRETYFRLVDLFDWEYARTQFLLSVSRNRYSFALAGYRNEKSATDPALDNTGRSPQRSVHKNSQIFKVVRDAC